MFYLKLKKTSSHRKLNKTKSHSTKDGFTRYVVSLTTFLLTDEIDDDEVKDDVGEDEVRKSAFRTDPSELILVGRVNLKIWFQVKIVPKLKS